MRFGLLALSAALGATVIACSSSNKATPPTATRAAPAPAAQTAVIRAATPSAPAAAVVPSSDVNRIVDQVKLTVTDLTPGYGLGQFQGYQTNESAVVGFDDPAGVLSRMNSTGRLGGFTQSITTPDGLGPAGISIDVWKDAAGCKQFFDNYPKPEQGTKFEVVPLPRPLGDQSIAYKFELNGQTTYSVTWRRGRIVLGVGEAFATGRESLDSVLAVADLLDKKAQRAAQ